MEQLEAIVAANLANVRQRITQAAHQAGRSPDEITLVGVTKYVGPREIAALVAAGCTDLGESRPQQLWERCATLTFGNTPVRWHLIGHLQRNKVARTVTSASCLHSIDSERLLAAVDRVAQEQSLRPRVLLEVNTSRESAKHGLIPDELCELVPHLAAFPHVEIAGLMTMAALDASTMPPEESFASLRQLRDDVIPQLPSGIQLPELSMGMSGDFEIAIAQGATMVRVGSALWQGIEAS